MKTWIENDSQIRSLIASAAGTIIQPPHTGMILVILSD